MKTIEKIICILLSVTLSINVLCIGTEIKAVEVPTQEQDNYIKLNNENIETLESQVSIIRRESNIVTTPYSNVCHGKTSEQENSINEINTGVDQIQGEVNNDADGTIAYASVGVDAYPGYVTKYMDLKNKMNISADQMNQLIDYWLDINGEKSSELKNQGQAFIDASKQTELDPIFLLALAAQEGGWGVSEIHARKNNPYSINMVDYNVEAGYTLGDTFSEGIINGAIWINDHYYNQGQTTLHDMIYGSKRYSTSADHWISGITNIMELSYNYILNK